MTKLTPEERELLVERRTYVKPGEPYYHYDNNTKKVYIEKYYEEEKDKEGNVKEERYVEYSVEPTYEPKELEDICQEFIEAYCVNKNKLDWLAEKLSTPYKMPIYAKKDKKRICIGKDENGNKLYQIKGYKEVDIPFIVLRKEFAETFFGWEKREPLKKQKPWIDAMRDKYGFNK